MQQLSNPRTRFIAYDAVGACVIEHIIYLWRERWLPYIHIVKHTIKCHIYEFEKLQNTNNAIKATQDVSKSANEVTWDLTKWLDFQVTWSEDRKRSSDLEKIPSDLGFKIGERKRARAEADRPCFAWAMVQQNKNTLWHSSQRTDETERYNRCSSYR